VLILRSSINSRRFAGGYLLSCVILLSLPIAVAAIPLADYHKNLQGAITALDTLTQIDEEESVIGYQSRLEETITAIRNALPETQTVQSGEDSCSVDNSWLHKELDELTKSAAIKPERITQIVESLRAIEERVTELQKPGKIGEGKTEAREKLTNILARPEYASKARDASAIYRLLKDFARWLESFFPKRRPLAPGSESSLILIAQIVVVGISLAVLLYVVKVLIPVMKRSRKQKPKKEKHPRIVLGERLEPDQSATDLLSEAESLARAGELRAAIRKGYIALLVELGDRKLISLAQHKTNRDYLRSVKNIPMLHSRMSRLTDSFELHWYGFVQATQTDWHDFRAAYRDALQTRN
jgi:hypothetical protein